MDITEVLLKSNITHDDKSRRVLNTAPDKIVNITIDEIESGITIERLQSINVPVYMYGGQVTIHGIFTDIPSDLRVHGYKTVLLNQNKSLGIKYIAIDMDKKELLNTVSRFKKTRWNISRNTSDGYYAMQTFHSTDHDNDKKRAIECYNSTPDNLYIGSKVVGAMMYGGYAVICYIGAIYNENLWQLIEVFTGISSPQEYDNLKLAYDKARAEESKRWDLEREQERIARQAIIANAKQNFTAPNNWISFDGAIDKPGIYAYLTDKYDYVLSKSIPVLRVYQCKKHGTGYMTAFRDFADFNYQQWDVKKYHKRDTVKIYNGWFIPDKNAVELKNKPIENKTNTI